MNETLEKLVSHLDQGVLASTGVIPWGCPVPSFGDLSKSTVATLGLNPSNREFVDEFGVELDGPARRFHSLRSLGLDRWSQAKERHLQLIRESCSKYFVRNPYDLWFKKLDTILGGMSVSYYGDNAKACHLDLVPYATSSKWTALLPKERMTLLDAVGDTLGHLLRDSPVRLLVLNGASVISNFERMADVRLHKQRVAEWSLPRKATDVTGYAYVGTIRYFHTVKLKRDVLVLGFNHNIQSSFGVTKNVVSGIRDWMANAATSVLA